MEFDTQPQATSYKVDFLYDVQNTTERNYEFTPSNFTPLAVLAEGNALSKEFGRYFFDSFPDISGERLVNEKRNYTQPVDSFCPYRHVKETLRSIERCDTLDMTRSTLIGSEEWKSYGETASS